MKQAQRHAAARRLVNDGGYSSLRQRLRAMLPRWSR